MKNSIIAASAVLIGSVAASGHRAHPAFHQRHYAEEEVCTVYTTVYVTASERTCKLIGISQFGETWENIRTNTP
jgi:hypothetical protein